MFAVVCNNVKIPPFAWVLQKVFCAFNNPSRIKAFALFIDNSFNRFYSVFAKRKYIIFLQSMPTTPLSSLFNDPIFMINKNCMVVKKRYTTSLSLDCKVIARFQRPKKR